MARFVTNVWKKSTGRKMPDFVVPLREFNPNMTWGIDCGLRFGLI